MSWLDRVLGRKAQPQPLKASQVDLNTVRPAPIDFTLDSAAQETSERIIEKAREIRSLSDEIVQMTNGLLSRFEAPNETTHPPK